MGRQARKPSLTSLYKGAFTFFPFPLLTSTFKIFISIHACLTRHYMAHDTLDGHERYTNTTTVRHNRHTKQHRHPRRPYNSTHQFTSPDICFANPYITTRSTWQATHDSHHKCTHIKTTLNRPYRCRPRHTFTNDKA